MKRPDYKTKVIKVVQVGNRRFSTAKAAAQEYSGRSIDLWQKYRGRYIHNSAQENEKFWELRQKMERRVLPIFERALRG